MPNNRPVRRSQLISPFGVGAMVDFPGDESLMTAGLDEWPFATLECPPDWLVREERLQARLRVNHFRLPPDYREPGNGVLLANQHIPFVRFPQWHYCPRRGAMEFRPLYGGPMKCLCRPGLDCHSIPERRRPWLIPSRFVAVCPSGHIEDFPFMEWVHRDDSEYQGHKLRLLPGRSSASLSGIKLECDCGKSESMADVFNFDSNTGGSLHRIGYDCSGNMPWVGRTEACGQYLRVVQRGASNIYFPLTLSSIYLPLWGEDGSRSINKILDRPNVWDALTAGLDDGKFIQRVRCEMVASSNHVDVDDFMEAAQRKLDGTESVVSAVSHSQEEFRRQEYEALRAGRGGNSTDLLVDIKDVGLYGSELASSLSGICLVRKLRETRVLVGFSRLLPVEDPASGGLRSISLGGALQWLPAAVVYGEGIFLEFNEDALRAWEENPLVKDRIFSLREQMNQSRLARGLTQSEVSPKYVLLHTFAHAFVSQLSFDCGYGSASLRERIYCESDDANRPMQGVLVYTASGDSEGTLGGLVRQGEPDRLRFVVEQALRRIEWCSSDPVCIESPGQGSDNANLAACHGCVLLPETSCETGNRLLDRGILIGTPDASGLGFFEE